MFDAPAETYLPTPSQHWRLINHHRAAIALPASFLVQDYAAKFFVPYAIALGPVKGYANLGDFTPSEIVDASLLDVAAKVNFEIDPENPYASAFTGHVRIEYVDGSVQETSQGHMRGGVVEPLTRDEIDAKFCVNVAFGHSSDEQRLLDICYGIGAMEGDFSVIRGFRV